jgi:predicted aldo/keto reductase-like oxidoreductase
MRSLLPGAESTAELALRFVLSNPHVSLAISGMNEMEQVVENIAVGADDRILSADEIVALEGRMADLKKMAEKCPQDIPIRKQLAEAHEAMTAGE